MYWTLEKCIRALNYTLELFVKLFQNIYFNIIQVYNEQYNDKLDFDIAKVLISEYKKIQRKA